MMSYYFEAVVFDGEIYCTGCLPDGVDIEDDDVFPIFADTEFDYVPVCSECGYAHDYVVLLPID